MATQHGPGAMHWCGLSVERRRSYDEGTGGPQALDEAILAARSARRAAAGDPELERAMTALLASHVLARWQLAGDPQALDDAVGLGRAATAGPSPGALDAHRNLCGALLALHGRTARAELLDEAVAHGRAALALSTGGPVADGPVGGDPVVGGAALGGAALGGPVVGDPLRTGCVINLGSALARQHQHTGAPEPLDEAIRLADDALRPLTPGDFGHAQLSGLLGALADLRYARTADPADLDLACTLAQAAAANGGPVQWANAAVAVLRRFGARGDLADVRAALDLTRRALDATPPGDPRRAGHLNVHAAALSHLAERSPDPATARRAADAARAAADATPAGDRERPGHLRNLATALTRLAATGPDLAPLLEAVRALEEALGALTPGHPDRTGCRTALHETLLALHHRTGDESPLDAAVDSARAALAESRTHPELQGLLLHNLSNALRARHRVHGGRAAIDEAVDAAREAARRLGPTPRAATTLAVLAEALGDLAVRPDLTHDQRAATLREQAAALRRAAALTPPDDYRRTARTGLLGWTLLRTAALEGGPAGAAAATEALRHAREALAATADGSNDRASAQLVCGAALHHLARTGLADPAEAVPEALALLRSARGNPAADAGNRLVSARESAGLLLLAGRPDAALDAVEHAVDLLPHTAPREAARGGRERGLELHGGLAAQTVAVAVAARRPDRALDLLERARGVLLAEELDGRRQRGEGEEEGAGAGGEGDGPDGLRPGGGSATGDGDGGGEGGLWPEREREYRTGGFFGGPDGGSATGDGDGDGDGEAGVVVARRVVAAAEWRRQRWSARVRRVAGAVAVAGARGDGPVTVTAGAGGGHALIVRPDGVRAVELPLLREGEAAERARRLLAEPEGDDLSDTLAWLWAAAAEPVLRALDPAPGARVWWCPTGPLAALPLHAAGAGADGVMDRVVSSYTPTARLLEHSRAAARRAELRGRGRALVVAVGEGDGAPLPHVRAEAAEVAALLPGAEVLLGERAGRAAVVAALRTGEVAHFACHAYSDPAVPMASGILLPRVDGQGPLTLADLSGLDLPAARLAYLSACETGRTRLGLADEAVHLAAGFQLAGFPQVIATLWTVSDRIAARIARETYRGAVQDGRLRSDAVPRALHGAVQRVRQRWPRAPRLWAGHQHYGA
ncbi:CHAT domain-containing protein [Kitasatospora phosalacinea]|uniref:CHAT domain-containing protein n=1 Tax=Kitasatospora phosalacinea TaxID=2065 RepID=UPI0035E143CE